MGPRVAAKFALRNEFLLVELALDYSAFARLILRIVDPDPVLSSLQIEVGVTSARMDVPAVRRALVARALLIVANSFIDRAL